MTAVDSALLRDAANDGLKDQLLKVFAGLAFALDSLPVKDTDDTEEKALARCRRGIESSFRARELFLACERQAVLPITKTDL